jgi:dihydroflavonol-4-reductase
MKVFVTGGNGFVGLNIVSALVEAGHDVVAVVRPGSNAEYLEPMGACVVRGGLDDVRSLVEAMHGADAVIHTAGNTSCNWRDLPQLEAVNVHGTRNVVDAAIASGVGRLVFTSTTSTVGAYDDPTRTADESTPLTGYRAKSPYAITKQQAEQIVLDANRRGLPSIILNPAEVVGAYDYNLQWGRMVLAVHENKVPFKPPGGASFCAAADVGRAHVAALTRGQPGERYLLAGENIPFSRFIERIGDALGRRPDIPGIPYGAMYAALYAWEKLAPVLPWKPPVETYRMKVFGCTYYYDSTKAERELGYRSATVDAMVNESVGWYRGHGFIA